MLYGSRAVSPTWLPCAQASELPLAFSLCFTFSSFPHMMAFTFPCNCSCFRCLQKFAREIMVNFFLSICLSSPVWHPSVLAQSLCKRKLQETTLLGIMEEHQQNQQHPKHTHHWQWYLRELGVHLGASLHGVQWGWCSWHYRMEEWQLDLPSSKVSFAAPTPVKGCTQKCKEKSKWSWCLCWKHAFDPWLFYTVSSFWAGMNANCHVGEHPVLG